MRDFINGFYANFAFLTEYKWIIMPCCAALGIVLVILAIKYSVNKNKQNKED